MFGLVDKVFKTTTRLALMALTLSVGYCSAAPLVADKVGQMSEFITDGHKPTIVGMAIGELDVTSTKLFSSSNDTKSSKEEEKGWFRSFTSKTGAVLAKTKSFIHEKTGPTSKEILTNKVKELEGTLEHERATKINLEYTLIKELCLAVPTHRLCEGQ